jgi:CDP-diacylglycerol--serine O-phosphatidyltransferase
MDQTQAIAPHTGLKKGLYLIPAAFTAANIGMGFLAVLNSMRGFQALSLNPDDATIAAAYFDTAAIAIGFAILFDTLDGRIARMTRTSSEIGVQLDSLADVLTFGIAPIALAYGWGLGATISDQSSFHGLAVFVLFMYLMCGTFRLARFNTQAAKPAPQIEEQPVPTGKKNFVGLPIPPAAGLIASVVHLAPTPLVAYGPEASKVYTGVLVALMAGLGLLMVSTIRYTSFKSMGTGKLNIYPILFIAGLGMLIWYYSQYVLVILAVAYVSHGLVWYVFRMLSGRKQERLADSQIDD